MRRGDEVAVGVIVMGLSSVNERAGTWDADFYLYEEWTPAASFAPQTEVVNEVERHGTQCAFWRAGYDVQFLGP